MISFANSYARLPERFFARARPESVPSPALVRANTELAHELGIDARWLTGKEAVEVLCGNRLAEGSEPIALAYAGHQFGNFVPQLGDGRAILLGETAGSAGRRDIQLKGAGRTPFSRGGDGKCALGPALREYLVSEAMHALGVPTTRALAVVTTGETVLRDAPLDGAVFTRVASSHIRVGTFQYFAARRDSEALAILVDYSLDRHFPEACRRKDRPLALLEKVIEKQAILIAKWMALGFIHGVMNTDNCAISGETIDYGPCAFMDGFHPQRVYSFIDHHGRYAWGNQPGIAHWNLARLAETLLPLLADDIEQAKAIAMGALEMFEQNYRQNYRRAFFNKLGVSDACDGEFIEDTLQMLAQRETDFSRFFRLLTQHACGDDAKQLHELCGGGADIAAWHARWKSLHQPDLQPVMRQANPVLIPRNHRIEQAIQAAYAGDFSLFHHLCEAWREPFAERDDCQDLEAPPLPGEEIGHTFCGT